MAIKSKEEILTSIKAKFGNDTSDEVLTFIEDISDSFTDLENKAKGDGKDWKAEATRIDQEWRQKYRDRFFSGKKDDPPSDSDEDDPPKSYKYEDLFKE